MINSFSVQSQTVNANNNITFDSDRVRTAACRDCCGWLNHDVGSGIFTLIKPGIYEITFNCTVENTGEAAVDSVFGISASGEIIPGTSVYAQVPAGSESSVGCSVLYRNCCGVSTPIAIENISAEDVTVDSANILITRLA